MDNLSRKEYLAIGALATAGIVWSYLPDEIKIYLFPSMVDKSGNFDPPAGDLVPASPQTDIDLLNQQMAAMAGPFGGGGTIGL